MKILQTNKAYYPVIGGIETIVANLSEGLQKRKGVSVEVLVCHDRRTSRTTREIINGSPVTYASTLMKIASLPISVTYPQLLRKAEGDILHIHEPFPLADLAVLFMPSIRSRFSKVVVSWHSDIVRQKIVMGLYKPLIQKFLDKVDRIVVATPHHIASSSLLQTHADKCEVIPFGILNGDIDANYDAGVVESIRNNYGVPLLLFVGRLVYYKGIQFLIDAMDEIGQAHLLIIGEGPLENELRAQIVRKKLSHRISMISPVRKDELNSFYRACDVFVLPSTETSEAFGIVQVEAMACGKPVVSTNLATGVTYINQHGKTGLTVPVRDASGLATAVNLLLNDRSMARTMGDNAKKRVLDEFTVDAMVSKTYDLYSRLLA